MCNCNKTPYCTGICDCVDWSNAEEWVRHIRENFSPERDVLTYESLETLDSKPAVLCVLGKCQKCGKQICIGGGLKDVSTFDALMERLFSDVFCCDRNSGTEIEDAVLALLHEDDRERGQDWIYMNRDKASSGRFDSINPKFNDRVRHVPGYTLELYKNLYTGLGADNADLDMIAKLSSSDVDWLRQQHAIRVRREIEIADEIAKYALLWNRYALETRMFGDALDIAKTERPSHTGNQWIEYDGGNGIRVHEISNAVYKMLIRVKSPGPSDTEQHGSVWWDIRLNAPLSASPQRGVKIIGKGKKDKILNEDTADRYVSGRKKAFSKFFTEEFPPIPKKFAYYFMVNLVLLPEYTLEKAN